MALPTCASKIKVALLILKAKPMFSKPMLSSKVSVWHLHISDTVKYNTVKRSPIPLFVIEYRKQLDTVVKGHGFLHVMHIYSDKWPCRSVTN